jgi:hypothetical protein
MLLEKEHGNSLPKEVITSLEEIQEGYHILALYSSALQSIEE